MMRWGRQQDEALVAVNNWLKTDQQVFRLFGYAGVGKTTLAKHFAEGVKGRTLFGAYTGKAAYVLREKGCPGASTIHSHIYHTKEKGRARLKELEQQISELRAELRAEAAPDETIEQIDEHRRIQDIKAMIEEERTALSRPTFMLNPDSLVKHSELIIIDECSMVDGRMGEDLLSFGTKVLVLGDPFQLPPVMGGGFFTEDHEPDFMLTDIHRQARDNPIIKMATMVREDQKLPLGQYGDSLVAGKALINESHAQAANQILVGRNKTRHASNRRMRALAGITEELPVPGDKLVCLRNNHDRGLLNGAIWHVTDSGELGGDRIHLSLHPDQAGEELPLDVEAHTHHFLGTEGGLSWWERKEAEEFDYGYALTVHKAQGSQWPHVLLFNEGWCFKKDKWRWLYTGITRAAESITVVEM